MNKYLGIILVFQALVSMCATELANETMRGTRKSTNKYVLSSCSCSDFVNENGFGKCRKTHSDFGGLVSCYVNLPTTCTDLVPSVQNPGKYLSAKACKNQKKTKSDKVIRGNEVRPKYKLPYQAFYAAGGYKCGGTIIGKRHVLTADHCIKGRRPTSDTFVIVGEHRVTSNDAYGSRPESTFGSNLIRVNRFIRRPGRNREDIGILELARDIRWSNRIQPACIPVRDAGNYVGRDSVVSGWGGTVQYNPGQNVYQIGSEVLLETTLRVQSPQSRLCQKAYASAPHKLCAYREGHDTCQGDSGGPMTIQENGKFVVIGVTSSGQGCGARGHAGIYTRVSHFHNWIKENVRDVCTPQTVSPITTPTVPPFTTTSTQLGTCSWLSPTSYDNIMQCGDGTSCSVIMQGWGCCRNHQGRAKCPKSDPFMCAKKRCAGNSQYCCGRKEEICNGNYGGLRPCEVRPITTPAPLDPIPTQPGCSCSDFVNKNGYGNCKKQDSDFGGLVSCYVNLPSTCTDLVQSGSNPGKYLSAGACKTAPYTPEPYYSTIQRPQYTTQPYYTSSVRCGSCQTWDSRWCRPGEIQMAETCGKCPTQHGWFYCGGEFDDCRITGQGRYRNCNKMGNFKQLEVN